MLDVIVVVDDAEAFHSENLAMNPSHYPALARTLGASRIAHIQRRTGACIYYHPFVDLGGQVCMFVHECPYVCLCDVCECACNLSLDPQMSLSHTHSPISHTHAHTHTHTHTHTHSLSLSLLHSLHLHQLAKYGVIETRDVLRDLEEWDTLYVSGRLHKPTAFLTQPPTHSFARALDANLK